MMSSNLGIEGSCHYSQERASSGRERVSYISKIFIERVQGRNSSPNAGAFNRGETA